MHRRAIQLPQEFVVLEEIFVFQLFGRNALERIPPGAVVLATHRSKHKRMIEVIWQEKRYVVFERDLQERMEPLKKPENEDDPLPVSEDNRKSA
jgi:hypothetical protein